MFGLAVDRRLARLGWGFELGAEGQITQFAFGHTYSTIQLGLGVRFSDFPWSNYLPTTFSVYTGPSYATDPPRFYTYVNDNIELSSRTRLLNYIGVELTVAIPHSDGLQAALRLYHRSGAFGLYTYQDDQGAAIGIGIRKNF
jgi:hypothetical protein